MPLTTHQSSSRGTPHGLFGSKAASRSHCASVNQNRFVLIQLPQYSRLNQSLADLGIPFMGLEPRDLCRRGVLCIICSPVWLVRRRHLPDWQKHWIV